jgi:Immunity protein 63
MKTLEHAADWARLRDDGAVTDVPPTDPVRAHELLEPTREVLETEIGRLAALIGASGHVVVGFDMRIDAGYPYIEIGAAGQLHWIVKERGLVFDHRTTRDPDELLYWSFETTTFSLASDWEVRHRDESQDFRIGLWAKQAELLHRLNPNWAQRWLRELAARQPADVGLFPELPSDRPGDST